MFTYILICWVISIIEVSEEEREAPPVYERKEISIHWKLSFYHLLMNDTAVQKNHLYGREHLSFLSSSQERQGHQSGNSYVIFIVIPRKTRPSKREYLRHLFRHPTNDKAIKAGIVMSFLPSSNERQGHPSGNSYLSFLSSSHERQGHQKWKWLSVIFVVLPRTTRPSKQE